MNKFIITAISLIIIVLCIVIAPVNVKTSDQCIIGITKKVEGIFWQGCFDTWHLSHVVLWFIIGCAIPGFTSQLAGRLTGIYIGNIHQTLNSTVANASSTGHYLASRTGATTNTGYKNGASILASTVVSTTRPSVNVYLSARNNNGTADNFSARELALASIGSGLSSGETSTLYTLIQAMQTSLSRNV